jgi:hypothetical protein
VGGVLALLKEMPEVGYEEEGALATKMKKAS